MKILLIAGHGNGDCGAVANGYKEAELTRELVKLIKPKLEKYATVEIADTSKNWYQTVCKNGGNLNVKGYDYALEIHFNACVNDTKGNGVTTGTEIYVTTAEKGTSVEQAIVDNIAALGLKNRGVKRKNWGLINYIKKQGVSSALLETCFIDDIDDMKIYKAKKDKIAEAVVNGIAAAFGLKKAGEKMSKFSDIKGHAAEKHIEKLEKYGIVNGDGSGKFNPDKAPTRAEVAIMIANALTVCGK